VGRREGGRGRTQNPVYIDQAFTQGGNESPKLGEKQRFNG